MATNDDWLEQMQSILEDQIAELRIEFFTILHQVCLEEDVRLDFPKFEDIFPSTPEHLWTDRMHDIYGQCRAYSTVADFLGSHIQDETDWALLKPHLLGTR